MTGGAIEAEVAVIGAGIIGASCAWHLAAAGIRTVLLDASGPAAGSSGACDGYVSVSTKTSATALDLAAASQALYPALVARLPGRTEFETCGGLLLIEDEADEPAVAAHAEAVRGRGLDVRLVGRAELAALEPGIAPGMRGAAFAPGEAKVNPYAMTLALVAGAQGLGARTLWPARVDAVERIGARIAGLSTTAGMVRAEQYVFAAGAASAALGALAGVVLPVEPRRGELAVTERTAAAPRRVLVSGRYLAAKSRPEAAAGDADAETRLGYGFVAETTATGQCVLGSTRVFAGFGRTVSPEGLATIIAGALRRYPALAGTRVLRAFAGLRPFVPDQKPLIGRSRILDNLIVATGHEGDGITLAPITGRAVAALAAGRTPEIDLSPFDPDRFTPCQP
ncbi:FAD-binding oxidoreductase [Arenibaculum sp.]|uniref:NAD(P)/FAD-dependent oxidoreductase n=1 Tax=Arenibaculum sp. TaxID=2865862 RepID=UPI002E0E57E5|nr:FAD-binding oxidoreductase [Arenibaculum sp.]